MHTVNVRKEGIDRGSNFSKRLRRSHIMASSSFLTLLLFIAPAWSQIVETENPKNSVEAGSLIQSIDVVGTRDKGPVKQNDPVAATLLGENQLQNMQIEDLSAAKTLVPSLQLKYNNQQNLTYNIRGIGNSSTSQLIGVFNGTNIYVDGVFLPRPGTWTTKLVNLKGVDVEKGPQGTTGGWDNTGGTVNIRTSDPPTTLTGTADVTLGNYNLYEAKASLGGPISDGGKSTLLVSAFGSRRDGYVIGTRYNEDQNYLNYNDFGARAKWLVTPNDNLTIRVSADGAREEQNCCVFLFAGAVTKYTSGASVSNNFYQRAARVNYTPPAAGSELNDLTTDIGGPNRQVYESLESYGTSVDVNYNLPNDYTLTSLTAIRGYDYHPHWHNNTVIGVDTNINSNGLPNVRSAQEEIKISTPLGYRLESTSGLFYYFEYIHSHGRSTYGSAGGLWYGSTSNSAALNSASLDYADRDSDTEQYSNLYALFNRETWHILPDLDLTAGLRFSFTQKTGRSGGQVGGGNVTGIGLTAAQQTTALTQRANALGSGSLSWNYTADYEKYAPSGTISLSYKITPDILSYATYSRGTRPGGLNVSTSNLPTGAKTTVDNETLDNYEIGLKTNFLNNHLTVNGALFWENDWNYITNVNFVSSSGTTTTYLANAKAAVTRGGELDAKAELFKGLSVYGSATYDDAYFKSFASAPCPFEITGQKSCSYTGLPIALVSKWVSASGVDYVHSLAGLFPRGEALIGNIGGDYSYQTSFFSDTTISQYSRIPAYGIANLHAGLRPDSEDGWSLTLWVHNLLDKRYYTTLTDANGIGAGAIVGSPGLPLMFGATVGVKL